MTRNQTYPHAGLVGGPNWTTVSLLNGHLTHQALAAIHNRRAPTDPTDKPTALQPPKPVVELRPARATAPALQSAA